MTSTSNRTASTRSFPIWRPAGHGTRTAPSGLGAAPRCAAARRQTLHREERAMHLGPAARQVERDAATQSPQVVVPQSRRGDPERRLRGHLSSETSAAGLFGTARFRVLAGLSVPCASHPIGTGPFKFVEFKPNEDIKVTQHRITGSSTPPLSTRSSIR